ncbi:MAG TPA: hypothetical protein VF574_01825 [Allosphingosinicella sp.]
MEVDDDGATHGDVADICKKLIGKKLVVLPEDGQIDTSYDPKRVVIRVRGAHDEIEQITIG